MNKLTTKDWKYNQCLYLGGYCTVTGESVIDEFSRWHTASLYDFHHINAKSKATDYENLIKRKCSIEVLNELDKCTLLRADMHRIVESQKLSGVLNYNSQKIPIHSCIFDPLGKNGWVFNLFIDKETRKKFLPRNFILIIGKKLKLSKKMNCVKISSKYLKTAFQLNI
jgi:hypothetical protein